jgi:hypothetical protein
MPIDRPFHRNMRKLKEGPNSGYSSWAYIHDRDYAKAPAHYVRAFLIIQSDLAKLFEYVEPSEESLLTYSYRIHELLMRTCIEIEANFKAIFNENSHTPPAQPSGYNMNLYKKVNKTHHLSAYEVLLPIWNGARRVWKPFEAWSSGGGLTWYQAYNSSKHDRQEQFKKANMEHLISAVAGLLVVLSAQFRTEDFSASDVGLSVGPVDSQEMDAAIGSMFRIQFPDDWSDNELYDFNWSNLSKEPVRFGKIDYDAITA